jgi:hypothetical protein
MATQHRSSEPTAARPWRGAELRRKAALRKKKGAKHVHRSRNDHRDPCRHRRLHDDAAKQGIAASPARIEAPLLAKLAQVRPRNRCTPATAAGEWHERRHTIMGTGSSGLSIFLIAVGAILYFAVSTSVSGLNLDTVGVILMIVGALGLVVSLISLGATRARVGRTTVVQGTTPVQTGTTVVQEGGR